MHETKSAGLREELGRHYASRRETAEPDEIDRLVLAMVAEDRRLRRTASRQRGIPSFVAAQVRFIPAWTWVAQVALVAIMGALARTAYDATLTRVAIGMLSAMTVLVGAPTMQASRLHGVAELEYSCPHDATSVLVARLVVLGCSSALAVALMVAATASSLNVSAFDVALWACPPFFLSCAGSLKVLRVAPPSIATTLCVAWTAACSMGLLALANQLPHMYTQASLASWATAAALALAWLVRETTLTLRTVSAGLDAFSPSPTR